MSKSGEAKESKPAIRVVLRRKGRETTGRRMKSEVDIAKNDTEVENSSEDSYSPMRSRLHALIYRTERIALLDSPNSSNSSEAEARHVLETLHLRFSSLHPPQPSQSTAYATLAPKQPIKTRVRKPTFQLGLRERRRIWQGERGLIGERRKGKQEIPLKRTIDKGAFLLVVNRQGSGREASVWQRPISACAFPGRRLQRPASRF
jgi:hypothetical protein